MLIAVYCTVSSVRKQAEARQFTAPVGARVMLRGVAEHTQGVIKAIASDGGYKVTCHYTL
jgi:hypothetical protein